jgi:hypothetical protein
MPVAPTAVHVDESMVAPVGHESTGDQLMDHS